LEFKPGWKIDFKKNAAGKIVGATWTGTILTTPELARRA
jgi:hypothetical protein